MAAIYQKFRNASSHHTRNCDHRYVHGPRMFQNTGTGIGRGPGGQNIVNQDHPRTFKTTFSRTLRINSKGTTNFALSR